MEITEEIVKKKLTELLDDLLEYGNQEGSFEIKKVDLKNMKFHQVMGRTQWFTDHEMHTDTYLFLHRVHHPRQLVMQRSFPSAYYEQGH